MDILEGVHGLVGEDPSADMKGSYDESGRGICGGSKIEELRECVDLIDGWYARRGVGRILSLVGELGLSLLLGMLLLILLLLLLLLLLPLLLLLLAFRIPWGGGAGPDALLLRSELLLDDGPSGMVGRLCRISACAAALADFLFFCNFTVALRWTDGLDGG